MVCWERFDPVVSNAPWECSIFHLEGRKDAAFATGISPWNQSAGVLNATARNGINPRWDDAIPSHATEVEDDRKIQVRSKSLCIPIQMGNSGGFETVLRLGLVQSVCSSRASTYVHIFTYKNVCGLCVCVHITTVTFNPSVTRFSKRKSLCRHRYFIIRP